MYQELPSMKMHLQILEKLWINRLLRVPLFNVTRSKLSNAFISFLPLFSSNFGNQELWYALKSLQNNVFGVNVLNKFIQYRSNYRICTTEASIKSAPIKNVFSFARNLQSGSKRFFYDIQQSQSCHVGYCDILTNFKNI